MALGEIQPWLMALADACGDSGHQAVICSHHPELIDYFGVEKGVFLERTGGRTTTVREVASMGASGGLKLSERIARGWVALAAMCESRTLREPAPPSLRDACIEYERLPA